MQDLTTLWPRKRKSPFGDFLGFESYSFKGFVYLTGLEQPD